MIGMHDVNSIRTLRRRGESIASISRIVGRSEPTVRKYLKAQDLSPAMPKKRDRPSMLDGYRPTIEGWLDEDSKTWRKQHHTARRIWQRLRDEQGCTASESTVRHYVARLKAERMSLKDAFLELAWEPGEAQVDFGEFDAYHYGVRTRLSFLVVDFPFSNQGLAQVTLGQNAECVCEGLKTIFDYIGGVPKRLVFDNAAGVGRKLCDSFRTAEMFGAFAAHYGFEFSFCNPESGNEKGGAENKVGAIRRSLFVPLPALTNLETYNRHLLERCKELSGKKHYKKGEPERQLFIEDVFALMGLPEKPFDVIRYETHRADKYGKVILNGNHRYSSDPAFAKQEMIVGIKAMRILLFDKNGTLIAEHERAYGSAPSDSTEPAKQLPLLCLKPGGWINSQVRADLSSDLRAYVDGMDKASLKPLLRLMRDEQAGSGYAATIRSMERVFAATGSLDAASVVVGAARIAAGDAPVRYDDPVDLSIYDSVFLEAQNG